MALNRKLDFGPQEDEIEKCAKLQLENEALQKQVKALQEKQKLQKPQKPPLPPKKSSIFLIIAVLLLIARVALFMTVEAGGRRAVVLGLYLNWTIGVAVVVMLLLWAIHDFMVEGWIVAGSMTFLLVTVLICCSVLDPVLLETGEPGSVQHPLIAAAALICKLSFCGQPRVPLDHGLAAFICDRTQESIEDSKMSKSTEEALQTIRTVATTGPLPKENKQHAQQFIERDWYNRPQTVKGSDWSGASLSASWAGSRWGGGRER